MIFFCCCLLKNGGSSVSLISVILTRKHRRVKGTAVRVTVIVEFPLLASHLMSLFLIGWDTACWQGKGQRMIYCQNTDNWVGSDLFHQVKIHTAARHAQTVLILTKMPLCVNISRKARLVMFISSDRHAGWCCHGYTGSNTCKASNPVFCTKPSSPSKIQTVPIFSKFLH